MPTYSLRAVWCAAMCWCVLSPSTCDGSLRLVNGTETNVLTVATFAGSARVGPGLSIEWPIDTEAVNTNSMDGTAVASWTALPGHDYVVTLATGGTVGLSDLSAGQTGWFWLGFATSFCAGLAGLGARWARRIMADTGEPQ